MKLNRQLLSRLVLALLFMGICVQLSAQIKVSGTVTDVDGETLIGVNINLSGTLVGTVTDLDGNYEISVPSEGGELVFSYVGYGSITEKIDAISADRILNVEMGFDALGLGEVVVTGTFSGRTQKTAPMSLTVLNGDQLQRLASNSQADILRTVPGITAEGGGGEVATNLFVRGFPSGGQYAFTPLQIDGVPILSTFGLNSSAHDVYFRNDIGLKNLEFVRGGSSTLFGAGSVAGIVNYTSVTGTDDPVNKVQLEWANGGRLKMDMLSAGDLGNGFYYAVSGFYRYDEGPLETGMPTRGYQIRGNVKKLFNEGNSSVTVYGQKIDDNVQFYLPYPLDNSGDTPVRPTGNDGEEIFTMLSGDLKDFSFDTPNGRFESPIGNGVITNGGFLMVDLKHAFGNDWLLSSKAKAASYEHWFNLFLDGDGVHNTPEDQENYLKDRELPSEATFTYVDNEQPLATNDLLFENRILDRQRDMQEMVGEVNLTKTVNRHNFTIGTFLSHTRAEDDNWIYNVLGDFSNSPRAVALVYTDSTGAEVPYSTGGFISGRQTSNRYHESSKVAFYAADEYKGDRFTLDVGLRWERAAGLISRENGVGTNNFQKGQVSASDIAAVIAGSYELNKSMNVYANFSRGYFFPQLRSVSFSRAGLPQTYETETVLQGELGLKYGGKKLSGTAAVFYNALSDRRNVDFVNDPNDPANVIEEVTLQDTRAIGIEANVYYNIVKGLDLYGNFTYQDHEFTKVESDPTQEGNAIARIPNVMGMAGISYLNSGFDFNLSANFLGSKFTNNANSVELDPFTIVRLDTGYKFPLGEGDESLRIGLSVFNLLDAAGVTEGSPRQGNSQVAGGNFFVGRPILPRRVFVRAAFEF